LFVQSPLAARRQATPTGVIEALSAGYAAVNRQLWILLLPVLVDVFLWFGPHVSYSPLVDPTVTRATEWARQVATGPRRTPRNPELAVTLDDTRQWVLTHTDEVNVLSLVARGPIALPSLATVPSARGDLSFVTDWGSGVGLLVGILSLGLVLGGCFYSGLAGVSAGRLSAPIVVGPRTVRSVLRVLGLVATLIGATLLLGAPLLLLLGSIALFSPFVAMVGLVLLAGAALFVVVHLFFALNAIFISNVGPLAAIQRSVAVVRTNLWPSATFVLLTWLILAGMGRVWDVVASNVQSPYGIGLSILGNAYIASGLIAASMIFYRERTDAAPSGVAASVFS
jgi:hypothetical protein